MSSYENPPKLSDLIDMQLQEIYDAKEYRAPYEVGAAPEQAQILRAPENKLTQKAQEVARAATHKTDAFYTPSGQVTTQDFENFFLQTQSRLPTQAEQNEFLGEKYGRNSSVGEDILTGLSISFGDLLPASMAGLYGMVTGNEEVLNYAGRQLKEAEDTRLREYSNKMLQSNAAIEREQLLREQERERRGLGESWATGTMDFVETLNDYRRNPYSLLGFAAENASSMVTTPSVGASARIAGGKYAKHKVAKEAAHLLQKGGVANPTQAAIDRMKDALLRTPKGKEYLEQYLRRSGEIGGIVEGISSEAGSKMAEEYQNVINMDADILKASPIYQEYMEQNPNASFSQARHDIGLEVGRISAASTAAIAGVAGKVTGAADIFGNLGRATRKTPSVTEKVANEISDKAPESLGRKSLRGALSIANLPIKGAVDIAKTGVKGAISESAEELITSGGSALASNVIHKETGLDPNKQAWEGVGHEAASGVLSGAALGGVASSAARPVQWAGTAAQRIKDIADKSKESPNRVASIVATNEKRREMRARNINQAQSVDGVVAPDHVDEKGNLKEEFVPVHEEKINDVEDAQHIATKEITTLLDEAIADTDSKELKEMLGSYRSELDQASKAVREQAEKIVANAANPLMAASPAAQLKSLVDYLEKPIENLKTGLLANWKNLATTDKEKAHILSVQKRLDENRGRMYAKAYDYITKLHPSIVEDTQRFIQALEQAQTYEEGANITSEFINKFNAGGELDKTKNILLDVVVAGQLFSSDEGISSLLSDPENLDGIPLTEEDMPKPKRVLLPLSQRASLELATLIKNEEIARAALVNAQNPQHGGGSGFKVTHQELRIGRKSDNPEADLFFTGVQEHLLNAAVSITKGTEIHKGISEHLQDLFVSRQKKYDAIAKAYAKYKRMPKGKRQPITVKYNDKHFDNSLYTENWVIQGNGLATEKLLKTVQDETAYVQSAIAYVKELTKNGHKKRAPIIASDLLKLFAAHGIVPTNAKGIGRNVVPPSSVETETESFHRPSKEELEKMPEAELNKEIERYFAKLLKISPNYAYSALIDTSAQILDLVKTKGSIKAGKIRQIELLDEALQRWMLAGFIEKQNLSVSGMGYSSEPLANGDSTTTQNTNTTIHPEDAARIEASNKVIGYGTRDSDARKYAREAGTQGNSGNYSKDDNVSVFAIEGTTSEGNSLFSQTGDNPFQALTFGEMGKAVAARANFILPSPASISASPDLYSSYRDIANWLTNTAKYTQTPSDNGLFSVWTPTESTPTRSIASEISAIDLSNGLAQAAATNAAVIQAQERRQANEDKRIAKELKDARKERNNELKAVANRTPERHQNFINRTQKALDKAQKDYDRANNAYSKRLAKRNKLSPNSNTARKEDVWLRNKERELAQIRKRIAALQDNAKQAQEDIKEFKERAQQRINDKFDKKEKRIRNPFGINMPSQDELNSEPEKKRRYVDYVMSLAEEIESVPVLNSLAKAFNIDPEYLYRPASKDSPEVIVDRYSLRNHLNKNTFTSEKLQESLLSFIDNVDLNWDTTDLANIESFLEAHADILDITPLPESFAVFQQEAADKTKYSQDYTNYFQHSYKISEQEAQHWHKLFTQYRFIASIKGIRRNNKIWNTLDINNEPKRYLELLMQLPKDATLEMLEDLLKQMGIEPNQAPTEYDLEQIKAMQDRYNWFKNKILEEAKATRHRLHNFVPKQNQYDTQSMHMPLSEIINMDFAPDGMADEDLINPHLVDSMFIAYTSVVGEIGTSLGNNLRDVAQFLNKEHAHQLTQEEKLLASAGTLLGKNTITGATRSAFGFIHDPNVAANIPNSVYETVARFISRTLEEDPEIFTRRVLVNDSVIVGYTLINKVNNAYTVGERSLIELDKEWRSMLRDFYTETQLAQFYITEVTDKAIKKKHGAQGIMFDNRDIKQHIGRYGSYTYIDEAGNPQKILGKPYERNNYTPYSFSGSLSNNIPLTLAGISLAKENQILKPRRDLLKGAKKLGNNGTMTQEQIDAENIAAKTPRKLNKPMLSFFLNVTPTIEEFNKLNGIAQTDEEKTQWININQVLSLNGAITRLNSSFHKLHHLLKQMQAARETGLDDWRDIPIFINSLYTSVQRAQNQGEVNDMQDKFHRNILGMAESPPLTFNPFIAGVNYNQVSAHQKFWMVAVGANLGLGHDKQRNMTTIAQVAEILEGRDTFVKGTSLLDLVKALALGIDENTEFTHPSEIGNTDYSNAINTLTEIAADNYEMQNAILELATLYKLSEEGTKSITYSSNLRIEIDGITNGPFHSRIMMGLRGLSYPQMVDMLRKSGLFEVEGNVPIEDVHAVIEKTKNNTLNGTEPLIDTYVTISSDTDRYVQGAILKEDIDLADTTIEQKDRDNLKVNQIIRKFIFDKLEVLDVQIVNGQAVLTVLRNGSKNATTITVYGATASGIKKGIVQGAGQGVQGLSHVLYDDLTKSIEEIREYTGNTPWTDLGHVYDNMVQWAALVDPLLNKKALIQYMETKEQKALNGIARDKLKSTFPPLVQLNNAFDAIEKNKSDHIQFSLTKLRNYSLSNATQNNIANAAYRVYTKHLIRAIDEYFAHSKRSSALITAAVNFGNNFANAWFKKMYNARLAELRAAPLDIRLGARDELPPAEVNFLLAQLREAFPNIQMHGAVANLTKKGTVPLSNSYQPTNYLAGYNETPTKIEMESVHKDKGEIGVSGIPRLIIPIDALTQNYNHILQGEINQLYINMLDAIDISPSELSAIHSEIVNVAEFLSIMNSDPLKQVADYFENVLKLAYKPIAISADTVVHSPLQDYEEILELNNAVHPLVEGMFADFSRDIKNPVAGFVPPAATVKDVNGWANYILAALRDEQEINEAQRTILFSNGIVHTGNPRKITLQQMGGIDGGYAVIDNGQIVLSEDAEKYLVGRGKEIIEKHNKAVKSRFSPANVKKAVDRVAQGKVSFSKFYGDYLLKQGSEVDIVTPRLEKEFEAHEVTLWGHVRAYFDYIDGTYVIKDTPESLEKMFEYFLGTTLEGGLYNAPELLREKVEETAGNLSRTLTGITSLALTSMGVANSANNPKEVQNAIKNKLKTLKIKLDTQGILGEKDYAFYDGKKTITIRQGMSLEQTSRELAHEINHFLLRDGVREGVNEYILAVQNKQQQTQFNELASMANVIFKQMERFVKEADGITQKTRAYRRIARDYNTVFLPTFEQLHRNPKKHSKEELARISALLDKVVQEFLSETAELIRSDDIDRLSFFTHKVDITDVYRSGVSNSLRTQLKSMFNRLFDYLAKLFGVTTKEYLSAYTAENSPIRLQATEKNLVEAAVTLFINQNYNQERASWKRKHSDRTKQLAPNEMIYSQQQIPPEYYAAGYYSSDEEYSPVNQVIGLQRHYDLLDKYIGFESNLTDEERALYQGALYEVDKSFLEKFPISKLNMLTVPAPHSARPEAETFFEAMNQAGINKGASFEYTFETISYALEAGSNNAPDLTNFAHQVLLAGLKQIKPQDLAKALNSPSNANIGALHQQLFGLGGKRGISNMLTFARLVPEFENLLKTVDVPAAKELPDSASWSDKFRRGMYLHFDKVQQNLKGIEGNTTNVATLIEKLNASAARYDSRQKSAIQKLESTSDEFFSRVGQIFKDITGDFALNNLPSPIANELKVINQRNKQRVEEGLNPVSVGSTFVRNAWVNEGNTRPSVLRAWGQLLTQKQGYGAEINRHRSARKAQEDTVALSAESQTMKLLKDSFHRELNEDERKSLHYWIKLDSAALTKMGYSDHQLGILLRDLSEVDNQIQAHIATIAQIPMPSYVHNYFINEAKSLGARGITGGTYKGYNLSNAVTIFDALVSKLRTPLTSNRGVIINALDAIASLQAIKTIPALERGMLAQLYQEEEKADSMGFQAIDKMLANIKEELIKRYGKTQVSQMLSKGYLPQIQRNNAALQVVSAKDLDKFHGYRTVKEFNGLGQNLYLIYSPTGLHSSFVQQAMSTLEATLGHWVPSNQTLSDKSQVKMHASLDVRMTTDVLPTSLSKLHNTLYEPTNEQAGASVYHVQRGKYFNSSALSEIPNAERDVYLDMEYDAFSNLARYFSRTKREKTASRFNEQLVKLLYEQWIESRDNYFLSDLPSASKEGDKRAYIENPKNFINVSEKHKDPVIQELWRIIPDSTKNHIETLFGKDGFMINRNDLYDVLGFRQVSVTQLWYKQEYSEIAEVLVKFAEAALGKDAIHKLRWAEKAIQDSAQAAKVMIVIRNFTIPLSNFLSNIFQLSQFGVSFPFMAQHATQAVNALRSFDITLERLYELRNKKELDTLTVDEVREFTVLTNQLNDNPMTEMLANGLRSTIVEDLDNTDSTYLWDNLINIDIGDSPAATVVKSLFMTEDSQSFQMMNDFISSSDLVAKYILYRKYTDIDKMFKEEAVSQVMDAFIDYQRAKDPTLHYLEKMGMVNFISFAIGAQRLIWHAMTKHPTRFLLNTLLANSLNAPTILDGFFATKNWGVTTGWWDLINQGSSAHYLM